MRRMISIMLKPKTILIFSGLVLGSLLEKGYANPANVCRKSVVSVAKPFSMLAGERETLTQNIMGKLKTMLGEEIRGLPKEQAQRMDEVFYREVGKKIASLKPRQLRKMEGIVMRDRDFPTSITQSSAVIMDYFGPSPAIVLNPNLPLHHPYRRIVLIHELEYVIDLVSGRNRGRTKSSQLRRDVNATIAEYQYINLVFDSQDLEGLERNFPGPPQGLLERMDELYRFPQHTHNWIFFEGLSIKEAIARHINNSFLVTVQNALMVDEDIYIKSSLEPYKN